MDRQVHITLTGRQRDEENNETVTEQSADGECYQRNGSLYILYEETAEDGGRTKNIIKLKDQVLELTKKGAVSACMVFEPGQEHITDYATPFGLLRLGVLTHRVNALHMEGRMDITADYDLTESERIISRCKIFIKIQNKV